MLNIKKKPSSINNGIKNKLSISKSKIKIFENHGASIKLTLTLLVLFFISIYLIIYFDKFSFSELLKLFLAPNSENVVEILLANSGGDIILGLLGIVMTVVAIIVELAANRYTARVSDLFIKDKVNMLFLILLTSGSLNLIVILFFSRPDKIPTALILTTTIIITICVLTLIPYFIYVFKFLEPNNIISKIEKDILKNVKKARRFQGINFTNNRKINFFQANVVQGIDQLTDIILNSIQKQDKILATNCIKSLSNFGTDYLRLKSEGKFKDLWFHPSDYVRYNNADFITLPDESFELILKEKTWVEHKIFRQFQTIFQNGLNVAQDICYFTAQCFNFIGITAIKINDKNVCQLIVKFFNTLLRSTINAMDVRTCFNILNQYKLFAYKLIEESKEKLLIEIAWYFKYYGVLAKQVKNIPFILETVAHDLCDINKQAFLAGLDKHEELLDIILNVDQPLEGDKSESSLRGIRKAQIMLATFYISQNSEQSLKGARKIFNDVLDEVDRKNGGFERIFDIIKELKYIKAEFWEIIDRGFNIDYIPDQQKIYLITFLDWIIIRQVLVSCYKLGYSAENKNKINQVFNEFIGIISSLPVETPLELKEFESIFQTDGIDNKINVYKHITGIIKYLQVVKNLIYELKLQKDFSHIEINEALIKNLVKFLKFFEIEFEKKYIEKC